MRKPPQRFRHEGAPGVVDDESRRVLAAHRRVTEALGEIDECFGSPRLGEHPVDHLDDLQDRHRIEEVVARDPARSLARRGHGRDREGRSVGREDAILGDGALQCGQQLFLLREVFDDGFDHHVARREGIERRHDFDAAADGLRLGGAEPAFLGELAERLRDRVLALLRGAGLGVVEQGARAALREHLCNAAAHGAGTGDAGDEVASGDIEHGGSNSSGGPWL
jgi:hypothetical protein